MAPCIARWLYPWCSPHPHNNRLMPPCGRPGKPWCGTCDPGPAPGPSRWAAGTSRCRPGVVVGGPGASWDVLVRTGQSWAWPGAAPVAPGAPLFRHCAGMGLPYGVPARPENVPAPLCDVPGAALTRPGTGLVTAWVRPAAVLVRPGAPWNRPNAAMGPFGVHPRASLNRPGAAFGWPWLSWGWLHSILNPPSTRPQTDSRRP